MRYYGTARSRIERSRTRHARKAITTTSGTRAANSISGNRGPSGYNGDLHGGVWSVLEEHMTLRRILVVLAILAVGGAAYAVYSGTRSQTANAAATTGTQTATVTRGNLIATVNSAGPIAARRHLMVTFGTAGTVSRVYAQLGDRVKQGQVLAELDTTDLQIQL